MSRKYVFIGLLLAGVAGWIVAVNTQASAPPEAKSATGQASKEELLHVTASEPQNTTLSNGAPLAINLEDLYNSVNQQRQQNGLRPLVRDALLDKSAQEKCADMVELDYWSHNSPSGKTPWDFVAKYNSYYHAGENLAYGFNGAQAVVGGWMRSETHKANVLNVYFTNVGYAQCTYKQGSKTGRHALVVQHLADVR